MKLAFTCMECVRINGEPSADLVLLEIRNDGLYEFTCSSGHRALTALQQQKFEVLYEIGAYAILDGYYREAVSSFTAAMERFHEFYVRVMCFKTGVEEPEWSKTWKLVAAQSERQFGAFVLLHTAILGATPEVLSNKWREFRNDVIHKGLIPTRSEALEYGELIRKHISSSISTIRSRFKEEMGKAIGIHLSAQISSKPSNGFVAMMCIPTIVTLVQTNEPEQHLESALLRLADARSRGLVG